MFRTLRCQHVFPSQLGAAAAFEQLAATAGFRIGSSAITVMPVAAPNYSLRTREKLSEVCSRGAEFKFPPPVPLISA